MTRPGIEPSSSGPLANTLTIMSMLHWTRGNIMRVELVDNLENFEFESDSDNPNDHGNLNEMSADTNTCDEDLGDF